MSYEPALLIERKDLMAKEEAIVRLKDEELKTYLEEVLEKHRTFSFKEYDELLIMTPEFSSFNKKVRDFLKKWNIPYGESN